MFSGIGAQERGFRNSNLFDIDVLTTSDISKEATLSYAAIHCGLTPQMVEDYNEYPTREEMAQYLTDINLGYEPEKNKHFDWFKLIKKKKMELEKYWLATKLSNNLGDISKIEDLPYADFWSISFCCQDISVAGKMKGLKPDSGTRSSLLWDNIKLLEKAKNLNKSPQYVMFENVKNLVSKSFIDDFNDLIEVMSELGFDTYWEILNGNDCGIPQNRERVFVICIRKDIDDGLFYFPTPFDNGLRLRDLLDDVVDEKYYISNDKVEKILNSSFMQEKLRIQNTDKACSTLLARGYKDPKCVPIRIGNVYGEQFGTGYAGNVWDKDAVCPTLMTMQGGGRQPHVIEDKCGIDKSVNGSKEIEYANCITAREDRGISNRKAEGTAVLEQSKIIPVGQISSEGSQSGKVYDSDGVSQTICACTHGYAIGNVLHNIRVRKLTPMECGRLMGFADEDNKKCEDIGVANSHLYKNYGNSIITNCVELLAEHLYKAQYDNTYRCFDENFTNPQED